MPESWKTSPSFRFSFAVFVGVMALFGFLNSPFFSLSELSVEGNQYYSDEEILIMSGIYSGQNTFRVDDGSVVRTLCSDPRIETAHIERESIRHLRIVIEERQPRAAIKYGSGYLLLDAGGVFMGQTSEMPDVPLITGYIEEGVRLGAKAKSREILAGLGFLGPLDAVTLRNISEISLTDLSRIVAYTRDGTTVVLGPETEMGEKARVFDQISEDLRLRGNTPRSVDLTSAHHPIVR